MTKLTQHSVFSHRRWFWLANAFSLSLMLTACAGLDFNASPQPPTPMAIAGDLPAFDQPSTETDPEIGSPNDGPTPNAQSVPGLPSNIIGAGEDPTNAPVPLTARDSFEAAPDRDLYQLAAELKLDTDAESISRIVNPNPVSFHQGREDTFWLVNFRNLDVYQAEFELRLVTPHAYWWVQKGQNILERDLERGAEEFEDIIYPRVSAAFGNEWSPGIDNDPHLNIIHAPIEGVAGYFSSSDEHPISVFPYSNQREAIYINSRALSVGDPSYLEVLAHELQHAIHWANDGSEDTWVNEGLSDLAVSAAGYTASNISRFLRSPTTSLVHWPLDNSNIFAHYGGSALFFHYLREHYSDDGRLIELVNEPADGIAGIDAYLANQGYDATFQEVFGDWSVANVLDQSPGRYGYRDLQVKASISKTLNGPGKLESKIPQYSAEYIELTSLRGQVQISFDAPSENRLLPTDVGAQGCWWSNSGDSINSTLSRNVDLRGATQAEFTYQVWHQIEQDWDYAYVEVSTDGGHNWQILETPNTSPQNPVGNSFGPGYTGSREWTDEQVDLSSYSGQEVQVRLQYVTDDAINGPGLCFRNLAIPAAGVSAHDGGWKPDGFVLIDNRVKQDYIVRVVKIDQNNQVSVVKLEHADSGTVLVDSPESLNQLIVVVAALAPGTLEPAAYSLTVEPSINSGAPAP